MTLSISLTLYLSIYLSILDLSKTYCNLLSVYLDISIGHDSRKMMDKTSYYNSFIKHSVSKVPSYFNWNQILFEAMEWKRSKCHMMLLRDNIDLQVAPNSKHIFCRTSVNFCFCCVLLHKANVNYLFIHRMMYIYKIFSFHIK